MNMTPGLEEGTAYNIGMVASRDCRSCYLLWPFVLFHLLSLHSDANKKH